MPHQKHFWHGIVCHVKNISNVWIFTRQKHFWRGKQCHVRNMTEMFLTWENLHVRNIFDVVFFATSHFFDVWIFYMSEKFWSGKQCHVRIFYFFFVFFSPLVGWFVPLFPASPNIRFFGLFLTLSSLLLFPTSLLFLVGWFPRTLIFHFFF